MREICTWVSHTLNSELRFISFQSSLATNNQMTSFNCNQMVKHRGMNGILNDNYSLAQIQFPHLLINKAATAAAAAHNSPHRDVRRIK